MVTAKLLDSYFEALAAGDVSLLPLSPHVRFTENGQGLPLVGRAYHPDRGVERNGNRRGHGRRVGGRRSFRRHGGRPCPATGGAFGVRVPGAPGDLRRLRRQAKPTG